MEDRKQEDLDMFYILGAFKNGLKSFFRVILNLVSFSFKNIARLSLFMFISVLLFLGISLTVKPYYRTDLVVAHSRLNNEFCSEMIKNLDTYIEGDMNTELANVLGISLETANDVKQIAFKPVNENLSKRYADSIDVLLPFKVEIEVYDKKSLDTLQDAIMGYLESNPLAMKLKNLDKENYLKIEEKLKKEIIEIDSLKQIVNQSIIPRVTGNGIILGEPIDPVSIYRRAMDIFDKQLVLAKKQQYIDSFEVVVGFNKGARIASSGKLFYIFLGICFGYLIGLLYLIPKRQSK